MVEPTSREDSLGGTSPRTLTTALAGSRRCLMNVSRVGLRKGRTIAIRMLLLAMLTVGLFAAAPTLPVAAHEGECEETLEPFSLAGMQLPIAASHESECQEHGGS